MPLALQNVKKKRQLADLRVRSVAFVDKGANRRPFLFYKRAEGGPEREDNMARPIDGAKEAVKKATSLQEIIGACLEILKGNPDEAELGEVVKMLEEASKIYPKPETANDGSYPYPYPMSKNVDGKNIPDMEKVVAEVEKRAETLHAHNKDTLIGAVKVVKSALENTPQEIISGDEALKAVQTAFAKSIETNLKIQE
jgi:hypothetical protein